MGALSSPPVAKDMFKLNYRWILVELALGHTLCSIHLLLGHSWVDLLSVLHVGILDLVILGYVIEYSRKSSVAPVTIDSDFC
jgi:hypothetical protein